MKSTCITCGTVIDSGTRCDPCRRADDNRRIKDHAAKTSSTTRGYDQRWRRLSERARKLQPFCSDCGARDDLQADHSPAAWRRKEKGLAVRLRDIDVVCGACNRRRGAARGKETRRA